MQKDVEMHHSPLPKGSKNTQMILFFFWDEEKSTRTGLDDRWAFFCQRVHRFSLHPHQEATCGWSRSIKAWISFMSKAFLGRVTNIYRKLSHQLLELGDPWNSMKPTKQNYDPAKIDPLNRTVPGYFGLWNESATVWDHPCVSCNPSDTFSSSSPLGTFFTLIIAKKTPLTERRLQDSFWSFRSYKRIVH